jgi:hypothetical protein
MMVLMKPPVHTAAWPQISHCTLRKQHHLPVLARRSCS